MQETDDDVRLSEIILSLIIEFEFEKREIARMLKVPLRKINAALDRRFFKRALSDDQWRVLKKLYDRIRFHRESEKRYQNLQQTKLEEVSDKDCDNKTQE